MSLLNRLIDRSVLATAAGLQAGGHALERTGLLPGFAQTLQSAPDFVAQFVIGFHRGRHEEFRKIRNDPKTILIDASHADPKIAELGARLETMMQHPLVKRFKRRDYQFLLTDTPRTPAPKGFFQTYDKIKEIGQQMPVAALDTVIIPRSVFDLLSLNELEAMCAHELGHLLRCDAHVRRGVEIIRRSDHEPEKFADMFAAFMTDKVEDMKNISKKIKLMQRAEILALPDNLATRKVKAVLRDPRRLWEKKDAPSHPSDEKRGKMLDRLEPYLASEEGRSYVEAELGRRLEAEHRALFAHLYDREPGNFR